MNAICIPKNSFQFIPKATWAITYRIKDKLEPSKLWSFDRPRAYFHLGRCPLQLAETITTQVVPLDSLCSILPPYYTHTHNSTVKIICPRRACFVLIRLCFHYSIITLGSALAFCLPQSSLIVTDRFRSISPWIQRSPAWSWRSKVNACARLVTLVVGWPSSRRPSSVARTIWRHCRPSTRKWATHIFTLETTRKHMNIINWILTWPSKFENVYKFEINGLCLSF